jgi:hypothetical protein
MNETLKGTVRALKAFMRDMYKWERETHKLGEKADHGKLDSDEWINQQMVKLRAIQDIHCIPSKWRRKEFTVRWPHEYDLKTNEIIATEEKGPNKVIVQIRHTRAGIKSRVDIEMVCVDGAWKVHRRWALFKGKKPLALEL